MKQNENRRIDYLVIHCSATRVNTRFTVEALRRLHVGVNHWSDIGYHFYITTDGMVHNCRPVWKTGAHVRHFNAQSIGICYEGGLDARGRPHDTRTELQKRALLSLLKQLKQQYPKARIVGHYELGARKACPCFCASKEYAWLDGDG